MEVDISEIVSYILKYLGHSISSRNESIIPFSYNLTK